MNDTSSVIGSSAFTYLAWITSHWTEVGAGILMLLQGAVLVHKLRDRRKYNKLKDRRNPNG